MRRTRTTRVMIILATMGEGSTRWCQAGFRSGALGKEKLKHVGLYGSL